MALANQSTRIAMAASPAPRNTALIRKSSSTVPLPPSITRANVRAGAQHVVARAHRREQLRAEDARRSAPMTTATTTPRTIDCTAARAARVRVLLADAPRHRGGGADRQADGQRVDDRHQRFGDADGGDRVGAEPADEEDVHHGEHRLHQHLEHHRHGEQHDGAADRRLGVVLVRAADRFLERRPEGRIGVGGAASCAPSRCGLGLSGLGHELARRAPVLFRPAATDRSTTRTRTR